MKAAHPDPAWRGRVTATLVGLPLLWPMLAASEFKPWLLFDPQSLAAAGHSGGAITTVGLFSAHRDERLTAGLVIAGTDFRSAPFSGPPAGMLFVHGREDDTVTFGAGHTVFKAVPWSRAMLAVTEGGHVIEDASFEPITQTTTEFWRWSLYGDVTAKGRIPAAAAVGGTATLENEL